MNYSLIVVRYAKAFFELSKEKGLLEEIKPEVQSFLSICQESAEFRELLSSPVIHGSKKQRIFHTLFKENFSPFTMRFFDLVIENRRESYLPDIIRYFLEMMRKDLNIQVVTLSSASEIEPSLLESIKNHLAQVLNKNIEIEGRVKPEIIGGFIVRIDNTQFDGSVATSLKLLKQQLNKS
ncbi:MAG: ATP synthase F1 subunit delta [Bacteroidota bacterium]|nr:ATP synthase F1 subunit delta [Bacteroidota bacterium]